MGYDVRPAEAKDLPLLAEIEGAADQLFTSVFGDLDWEPPTDGEVRAAEPGFLLVAGDPVVGFVHVLFLDDAAHLQQLAVHPESMGRGVGTALLDGACGEARRRGFAEITLTHLRRRAVERAVLRRAWLHRGHRPRAVPPATARPRAGAGLRPARSAGGDAPRPRSAGADLVNYFTRPAARPSTVR